MSKYSVNASTMTGIADAVRKMRHEKTLMTPATIEAKIKASHLGIPIVVSTHMVDGHWVRPDEYPDLNALSAQLGANEDCAYFTYDLRKTEGYGWVGQYAETADGAKWHVERGHVASGAWVTDESHEMSSGAYFRQDLDDAYGDVQLWRVRSEGSITKLYYVSNTDKNANNCQIGIQPCVESGGQLLHLTTLASDVTTNASWNSKCSATQWIERDGIKRGGAVVSLSNTFNFAYSLQEIATETWDTTNWAVTTLASCFGYCYSLQSLDLSGWDTTNWAVTTLASCFGSCYSLQSLDLSGWDTTNWAVTTLDSTFRYCYSLQSLDLSGWDTTNWAVTTLASCFGSCYSLQSLDLSGWDTTNWAVTTLASCFGYCYSLQSLDLSGWDTTNFNISAGNYRFDGCRALRSLKGINRAKFATYFNQSDVPNLPNLEEYTGCPYNISHSYSSASKLTHDSVVAILTTLPTVTASRTITLGQTNKLKLTSEEIAVATQKGWTVA